MSAGTFIVACIAKTVAELRAADIVSAAQQHGIPVEWARYYLGQELGGRA